MVFGFTEMPGPGHFSEPGTITSNPEIPHLPITTKPYIANGYIESTRSGAFSKVYLTPRDMSQAIKAISCKLLAFSFGHGAPHRNEGRGAAASSVSLFSNVRLWLP